MVQNLRRFVGLHFLNLKKYCVLKSPGIDNYELYVWLLTTEMTDCQDQQKVTFEEDDLLNKEKPLTRTVTFGRQHSCDSEKPDGGWLAWTVVASSFMISFLQEGFG